MSTLLLISVAVLTYVFMGYPWLLKLLVALRGRKHVSKTEHTPRVSLVISAFNEAAVIRAKLENALALEYPRDLFEVAVISDASDDGTDEIVQEFTAHKVRLFRQAARRGKTAGLNAVVPHLSGDIVVFSDANAMYEPLAVRALVSNFGDPAVGCVTGEARYTGGNASAADRGEHVYWDYEIEIKKLETAVGSMVGGDGAIYAIRRALWQALPENAINDFLNPLQIVAAGWRNVYEPEAVAFEETAGMVRLEYRRRVRIVSRSWRAVFQEPRVLNPFRVGLFALALISHKVLRWFAGVWVLLAIGASLAMLWPRVMAATTTSLLVIAAVIAAAGAVHRVRRVLGLGWYFISMNVASTVGLLKGSLGSVSGVWTPPRVSDAAPVQRRPGRMIAVGAVVTLLVAALAALAWRAPHRTAMVAFWTSLAMLGYVYLGYPLLLFAWRSISRRPTRSAPVTPSVSFLIPANDEGDVIESKILNTLALDYPPELLDIVVASDGSVDGTNAIAERFAAQGVRLIAFPERRGKIGAINRAVPHLQSEIVVFSDANTFLHPSAVRRLVTRFADPAVGCVSADVRLVGERAALAASEDLYYAYERWLQATESEIGSMVGADGALYAIRRALYLPPPDDTILDDMAIPFGVCKVGGRVVYEETAVATEQGVRTALEEYTRKSRVVAGAVQFLQRSGSLMPCGDLQVMFAFLSHKVLRWLSPVFSIVVFVTAAALATTATGYLAVVAVQAMLFTAGLLGGFTSLRRIKPIGLAHYFWLVQAAAFSGLARGLTGRQPVRWQRFTRAHAYGAHDDPTAVPKVQ